MKYAEDVFRNMFFLEPGIITTFYSQVLTKVILSFATGQLQNYESPKLVLRFTKHSNDNRCGPHSNIASVTRVHDSKCVVNPVS